RRGRDQAQPRAATIPPRVDDEEAGLASAEVQRSLIAPIERALIGVRVLDVDGIAVRIAIVHRTRLGLDVHRQVERPVVLDPHGRLAVDADDVVGLEAAVVSNLDRGLLLAGLVYDRGGLDREQRRARVIRRLWIEARNLRPELAIDLVDDRLQ